MKQKHYISMLIGVGAIAILYLLWRESQKGSTAGQPLAPAGYGQVTPPAYPSVPTPIQLGNITIESAPPNQTYNVPLDNPGIPVVRVGTAHSACGCQDNDCEQAGQPVTLQTVPSRVLNFAIANYNSFASKGSA
jgi:hypothetical protein